MKKKYTITNYWKTIRNIIVEAESYDEAVLAAEDEDAILAQAQDIIEDDTYLIFEGDTRFINPFSEEYPLGYVFQPKTGNWDLFAPGKGIVEENVTPPEFDKGNVVQLNPLVTGSTR